MKNNKNIGNILIIIGVILILVSLIIWTVNLVDSSNAEKTSAEILSELKQQISVPEKDEMYYSPRMDMPKKEIKGVECIALLDIPAIDISLPVASKWTDRNLKMMPCCYSGSAYTDNLVIAGHNYRNHFGKISKLQHGDRVILTDMDGNVFNYQVDVLDVLEPTDIDEMVTNDWDLTFFTCNPSRSHRITVRCNSID